ncbi:MAG: YbbR-like domain-containing protein [Bacilli bacterium]
MKKIVKLSKTFFKKLFYFIDRNIIIPITKLILNITSKFDKSGRRFENWLSKTTTLLFISLFLSLVIFIVIDQKIILFNDNSAEVLKNQAINVIYNEEAYVVEGLPDTVDITLIGSKTDLYIAKQTTSGSVTIDLSGLKPGTHKVNIEYKQNTGSIDYMVNPSVATVIIYPKVSETRTLSVDLLNQDVLDSKLVIEKVNYDADKVVIKGAEQQLKKVVEVKALVNIDNIVTQEVGTSTIKNVPLKAYDSDGNVVDVEIVPETIDVDVVIASPSKELAIKLVPTGNVAFGYAISGLTSSETKVIAYGNADVLDSLTSIVVYVDVDGLKAEKDYKLEITKPVGIKSLSVNNITVKATIGSETSVDLENISIEPRNLSTGYTVNASSKEESKITVNLKGVSSVINAITADNVVAFVDLSGYTEGEYQVDVQVEGTDPKVTYTPKTKKITVKIVKN